MSSGHVRPMEDDPLRRHPAAIVEDALGGDAVAD
jgi:hypothetical protein